MARGRRGGGGERQTATQPQGTFQDGQISNLTLPDYLAESLKIMFARTVCKIEIISSSLCKILHHQRDPDAQLKEKAVSLISIALHSSKPSSAGNGCWKQMLKSYFQSLPTWLAKVQFDPCLEDRRGVLEAIFALHHYKNHLMHDFQNASLNSEGVKYL